MCGGNSGCGSHRCGGCCGGCGAPLTPVPAAPTQADILLAAQKLFLPLAGGTLTGAVITAADPVLPLEVANRHYVDSKITSLLALRPPVANTAALPATGNSVGDVRPTLDTGALWLWSGTKWDSIGKASTPIPAGDALKNGWGLTWNAGTGGWDITAPPPQLPVGQDGDTLVAVAGVWTPTAPKPPLPDGVNDLDLLTWDANSRSWEVTEDQLGDEVNVTVPTNDADGEHATLVYDPNNNTWDTRRLGVDDLAEVFGVQPNDQDVLIYDARLGQWVLDTIPTPPVQGPTPFKGAVANTAALPATAALGDTWVTLDNGHLHICTAVGPPPVFDDIGPAAKGVSAVEITQTAYDALPVKDPDTLFLITGP